LTEQVSIALTYNVPRSYNDIYVYEEYEHVEEGEENGHADGPDQEKPSSMHIARQGSASGLHRALQRWVARGASLPHLEIPLGAFAA